MKRKTVIALCMLSIAAAMGSYSSVMAEEKTSAEAAAESKEAIENELKDGIYTADFDTDSNMFHVNEAKDGKGTLTVKNGEMTIHVSLVSKSIVNLFSGKKARRFWSLQRMRLHTAMAIKKPCMALTFRFRLLRKNLT